MKTLIAALHIHVRSLSSSQGRISAGARSFKCFLGRNGLTHLKREGDGKSPVGWFGMRELLIRPDQLARPSCRMPQKQLQVDDGWCDASGDGQYNRKIRRPYPASHEALWRTDTAYDLLVVLDYNMQPRRQGFGSAIFFHLAPQGSRFTEGCVSVSKADMMKILAVCGPQTVVRLGPAPVRRK